MGQDYLEGKKDQARRGWNKASFSRRPPSLLDRKPTLKGRTVTAKLRMGQSAKIGDKLLIIVKGQNQSVANGNVEIADCLSLPEEVAADASLHGGAIATEVVKVNPISNTVELSFGANDKT
jgi:hypothetical protein